MAEKLYLPEELKPTRFLREGENYLTRCELCVRAQELRAVTGKKQFRFLWDNQEKIPEDWKETWGLLVPDPSAGVVRVLSWHSFIGGHWYRCECELYAHFDDSSRVLVPCELSS